MSLSNPLRNPESGSGLVAQAQAGDRDAFAVLWSEVQPMLRCIVRRFVGNPDDAEDVLQDVAMSVIRHLGSFRGDSSLATWMCRIARNQSLMFLRKRSGKLISLDSGDLQDRIQIRAITPTPEELYARRELQALLKARIGEVHPKYRPMLQLYAELELPTDEISKRLGIKPNTIRVWMHRVRLDLKYQSFPEGAALPRPAAA